MPDEPEVPEWVNTSRQTVVVQERPAPELTRRDRLERAAPQPQRGRAIYILRRIAAFVVLTVAILAVWALWSQNSGGDESYPRAHSREMAPPPAAEDIPESSSAPSSSSSAGASPQTSPTATLPQVPQSASGTLTAIDLPAINPAPGQVTRTMTVGLQIEDDAGIDPTEAANRIAQTLGDARGWQSRAKVLWQPISAAEVRGGGADVMLVIASPSLTDRLCAPLRTRGEVSCYNDGKAVLNARRWLLGAQTYEGDLAAYRNYLINHEVGHALGLGHVGCPGAGRPAPVMLQQTKSLEGCTKNPWPTDG